MKLITNRIRTGKPGSFEDFIQKYRDEHQIKTASVKVAEEKEEADSSGQLDVEPLHQKGESTTMPKAGPSAKKDDGEKSATADTDPEKEGEDSGQPKAEGSEKFTNKVKFDPNDSSDEEKGIVDASANADTKVAAKICEKCDKVCEKCTCDDCKCAACSDARQTKEAALEDLPQAVQDKIKGKSPDDDDDDDDTKDCKEEKESKDEEKDKEEKKSAQAPKFVKWANLDSKNKSFLITYWRQLFGDDYVSALVADK